MTATIHEDKLSSSEPAVLQARTDKLTADELHRELVSTDVNIREYLVIYQALVFSAKKRMVGGEKVGGCKTWKDYADTYLRRVGESLPTCLRRLRRLLEGVNPDQKYRNRRERPATLDAARQCASSITAKLTTFYVGLITDLAALTKSFTSNDKLDERIRIETQELVRSLKNVSKDIAERANRLSENLQLKAATATTIGEARLIEEGSVPQLASVGSSPAPSLQSLKVTECSKSEIAAFIEQHHYSKNVKGVTASVCFRVDRDCELVGAAIFGPPAMKETLGKYSEHGRLRLLELRRLYFVEDAPRNTESKMLAVMLRKLANRGIQRVLSYCDPNHGHYGTSYRGAGFRCLGQTSPIFEIWWQGRKWSTRSANHHLNDERSLGLREGALKLRAALESGEAVKVQGAGKFVFVKDLAARRPQKRGFAVIALTPPPTMPFGAPYVTDVRGAEIAVERGL